MSSLGGDAARGAFKDGSSRFNSYTSRRRQSFGGLNNDDETSPLKHRRGLLDSTGYRGGDSLRTETTITDRRAMLEAWRQARAAKQSNGEEGENRKRTRADPLLPPTDSRKIARTHISSQNSEDQQAPLSQTSTASYSVQYHDDESEVSLLSARTPRGRRGKLGSARRQSTLMGRSLVNINEGKFPATGIS